MPQTVRELEELRQQLAAERAPHEATWRDLAEHFAPGRYRANRSERGRHKDRTHVINSTPLLATRTLASGLMAGLTSPARAWHRLTMPDPDMAETGAGEEWLHTVEKRQRWGFATSNLYNVLHQGYEDLVALGTACIFVDDDDEDPLRAYALPAGSYWLGTSERWSVDTLFRVVDMTAASIVARFDDVPANIREAASRRSREVLEVIHAVLPLDEVGDNGHTYRSVWYLPGGEQPLLDATYAERPFMAPRWSVVGDDAYGYGPGHIALGDARALQKLELRKGRLISQFDNPPYGVPSSLRSRSVRLQEGEAIPYDSPDALIRPILTPNAQGVVAIAGEIQQHEERIRQAFFADLWLALTDSDRRQMTAREVDERSSEKALQLGPVMERLGDELLDPLIDREFGILLRSGAIPPAPEEIQGVTLQVEYTSVMAQAQKLLGISGIERLVSFGGTLATVKPEVLDRLDADEAFVEYGRSLGTKPSLLLDDDEVAAKREARAQAEQAKAQGEAILAATEGARNLAQADAQAGPRTERLIGALGGAASGAAGGAA